MNRLATRLIALLAMILSVAVLAPAAQATFPGNNGKIAFSSSYFDEFSERGFADLFAVNPDGSNRIGLTSDHQSSSPSWSPDGTKIAFVGFRLGFGFDIYVMNADGSGQADISNSAGHDFAPAWSPDGTKIAFVTSRDDPNPYGCLACNGEIYVMNAGGSNQTRLTHNPAVEFNPDWSPDGTKIAFDSNRDGVTKIFVMNIDGSHQTALTSTHGDRPSWSPDGTKIAFVGGLGQIYTMNADGSNQTDITHNDGVNHEPSWSPDGTKIAFSADIYGPVYNIWTMNADGSDQTQITDGLSPIGTQPDDSTPAWQPTGPIRSDFKNAAKFCKAEQAFWGDQFSQRYRNFGQCVSGR